MKKYQCLLCGNDINELDTQCPNCKTTIDMDLITKSDKLKVLKYTVKMNILNNEFKKNITLLDNNNYNELILEYYKMFSYKLLNKKYDESTFFTSNNFKYTNEELDEVILHILEHFYLYNISNIHTIINKSNNNSKYIDILNKINNNEYQKPIEKDLRNLLFNKVTIPETKKYDSRIEEGKSYLILSIILYILFIGISLIFFSKELRNPILNLALIVPTITFSKAISKLFIKKSNKLLTVLLFIITYYIITFIFFIIFNGFSSTIFVDHLNKLINTFSDIIKVLMERLGEQNAI